MLNLANKYRPQDWSEVVGQESIVKILTQQLKTNSIQNTYIFSGASGCGKTTIARIFALEINKQVLPNGEVTSSNPIEIDAASNNGVDNVKQIVASASERSLDGKYKIFIIDEAHMLTTQAWNAFLKCIEEPPLYTIFIFCTTDPQKIPDTIKNRCMRFHFSRIASILIKEKLCEILAKENIDAPIEFVDYLSRIANGEMRNALSMLDTCLAYDSTLSINNAIAALGNFSYDIYIDLVNAFIDGDTSKVLVIIDQLFQTGIDLKKFIDNFTSFCLDVLKYSLLSNINVTNIPESYEEKVKFVIAFDHPEKFYSYVLDKLLELKNMLKQDTDNKATIKIVFVQICRLV